MNKKKKLTTEETFALAIENHKKNNLQIAENLYKEILKTNPNHFESIYYLGTLLAFTRRFDLAKQLLHKAIQIQPNHAKAHNNLGVVLKELGEHQKAISYFDKAIQIDPKYEEAHSNLAILLKELGEHQKIINYYAKAILIVPNSRVTINGLSDLFKFTTLGNITKTNSTSLKELFLFLYRNNYINHDDIFHNAKLLLFVGEADNQVRQIVNSDSLLLKNKIIQNLSKEELFLLMLQKSLMPDKFLEKLLTKLRYEILFTLVDSNQNILNGYFDFIVSLAEQCLLNEYVYVQSKKEIDHVNQLKNKIMNNKEINELEMAILGCYIPLYTSKNIINKLLDYKSKNILFNDLITIHIKEPLKERKLVNSIKSFDKIFDAVSKKVRDQYEEHPYPRWRYTNKYLPSVIFPRSVNVFGPYQQLFRIIPRTILFLKMNKKIQINGWGHTRRSYLHISDVSSAISKLINFGDIGETYHIAPMDQEMSVGRLVEFICNIMDYDFESSVNLIAENYGQDSAFILNSDKLRQKTNWKEKMSLEKGIKGTIKWIEDNWSTIIKMPREYIHKI